MANDCDFDVLILGSGPAGSTAALVLARAGLHVTVLERRAPDSLRVGETLPPDICVPLQNLGLWETFRQSGHQEAPGILSCWGSAEPFENDFIFNPYGCGWHVDRRRFDRMLTEAAQSDGATIYFNTSVTRCWLAEDELWHVTAMQKGNRQELRGTWLIDASGRAGGPGPQPPKAIRYDRLIGCVAFFNPTERSALREPRTMIEARPQGWWYAASLPEDQLVLAWMTDADLLPATADQAAQWYWLQLSETTLTKACLKSLIPPTRPHRFAAHTSRRPAIGNRRLSTGDAVLAFDPLSAQGTRKALLYGAQAAHALLANLRGDETALLQYAAALTKEFQQYWQLRRQYYQLETRWSDSLFWQRRHMSAEFC